MRIMTSLLLAISTTVLITACSSTKLAEAPTPVEDRSNGVVNTLPVTNAQPSTVTTVTTSMDPLDDPKSALAKRSIYFDYDSYTVKNEFKPTLETHAQYLLNNKGRKIIIQGNTDERGGREYNLALGQKRAEVVRQSLNLLGVPDNQMEAVSLGKEKPKATGHDEPSWAENRRSDLVY